ncbi:transposase [Enterococcus sp. AZ191]
MNHFKGKQFQQDVIIVAVGYYLRYNLSYREVQEILYDRGINVSHTTIYRWVQEYPFLFATSTNFFCISISTSRIFMSLLVTSSHPFYLHFCYFIPLLIESVLSTHLNVPVCCMSIRGNGGHTRCPALQCKAFPWAPKLQFVTPNSPLFALFPPQLSPCFRPNLKRD